MTFIVRRSAREKLSVPMSLLVIGGLSALCWAAAIAVILGLYALI